MDLSPSEHCASVLLVEDDPGDQALTKRALEKGKIKIDLRIVGDGEEALKYLLHESPFSDEDAAPRPDLVLLDLNLPKVDGRQVLEQMRSHPSLRSIPVVALTTSKQEEDIVKVYELGVNSYITKPVEMNQFVETLRQLGNYWFQVVVLPPRGD